jgi:hypothetical protein
MGDEFAKYIKPDEVQKYLDEHAPNVEDFIIEVDYSRHVKYGDDMRESRSYKKGDSIPEWVEPRFVDNRRVLPFSRADLLHLVRRASQSPDGTAGRSKDIPGAADAKSGDRVFLTIKCRVKLKENPQMDPEPTEKDGIESGTSLSGDER